MSSVLDSIGFFGPGILFLESIWRLWNSPTKQSISWFYKGGLGFSQSPYLWGYLVTFGLNYPLNQFLKSWIKQPRPDGGRSLIGESYTGADHYGMPSLHAQSTAITIAFLFLVKGFSYWTLLEVFVLVLVIYQRLVYRRHTMEQLVVGTALGFVVGYSGWFITKNMIYRNTLLE